MIENHSHGPDGEVVVIPVAEPEATDAEAYAGAEVEVARIQADRDVQLAKIQAKTVEPDLEAQLAAALAENEALKAQLAPPVPEPEPVPPVPVIVDNPAPEPEFDDQEPPVADHSEHEGKPSKRRIGLGMW